MQAYAVLRRCEEDPFSRVWRDRHGCLLMLWISWHSTRRLTVRWTSRRTQDTSTGKYVHQIPNPHLLNILGCYDRGQSAPVPGPFPVATFIKDGTYLTMVFEAYLRGLNYTGEWSSNSISQMNLQVNRGRPGRAVHFPCITYQKRILNPFAMVRDLALEHPNPDLDLFRGKIQEEDNSSDGTAQEEA